MAVAITRSELDAAGLGKWRRAARMRIRLAHAGAGFDLGGAAPHMPFQLQMQVVYLGDWRAGDAGAIDQGRRRDERAFYEQRMLGGNK